ncbi:hypothetical protein HO173_007506 [Letharia columbiana]|uniref:TIM-barrel domain-containing protein n=1 Tax=Letharia columbiana TaxID=112416 RepID=A0A8H6FSS0_9LECA|nr:uncharacterized protein HO173_007506 [Letharia columbiana]KAF6234087.1 hypothetical protein HO173_007506 [Letharia columbiana]
MRLGIGLSAKFVEKGGADLIIIYNSGLVHLGLTTGGSIGAGEGEITLDDCVNIVQTIRDACVKIEPDIIVLCHGGPVSGVEDTRYVIDRVDGIHGFFGASSMERLPAETAIEQNARKFKNIEIGSR